jgi:alpha-tubulin suppressor-like RCC1 family protein
VRAAHERTLPVRATFLLVIVVGVTTLGAHVGSTEARLRDTATARSTLEALPTLWWATGDDARSQHGDGLAGPSTAVAARISWRPGVVIPRGASVSKLAAGDGSACAIAAERVYCWGDNSHGQLGDGTRAPRSQPVAVATAPRSGSALPPDATVTDVAVGAGVACAVASGNVYCWGDNGSGQLGDDSLVASTVPVAVRTGGSAGSTMPAGSATRVETGGGSPGSGTQYTCAIAAARAYCWGSRLNGRLGNGVVSVVPRRVPVAVNAASWGSSSDVTDLSVGLHVACAVADGLAYCWGRTVHGQLGDGEDDPGTNQTIPLAVETDPASDLPSSAAVSEIAVGATAACAVHGRAVYCWGTNRSGQLGADIAVDTEQSSTVVRRATAVASNGMGASELPVGARLTSLVAGGRQGGSGSWCVLARPSGGVARPHCWGDGSAGQLGIGTPIAQRVPRSMAVFPASELPTVDIASLAAGDGVTLVAAAS